MKLLILLFTISRLCECSLLVPVQYHGVTVGITPYSAPVNSHSQYLAQDSYGHYAYGYATDLSAQDEVKTADGVTRGGYSYIDANGILQTVQYISDPVHGFRVAATNLPKDLPEVAAARAQHLAQFEYIKAEHAAISASRAHLTAVISPVPAPGAYVVPVKAADVVVPGPALAFTPPVVAISSQYQAQDGHGQYSYGYADPNSAKSETKTADGVTRGGYSYIDANGVLQTVQYISDPVNGFRVAATNLPQAPSITLIGPKVTATVVGPKDNNAAAVAVAADTVIAPAVSAVPVHTYIDSIGVEQRPGLAQADIIQNAHVPLVNPVGPGTYIHPNPNHESVAVLPNHELPAPFYTGVADGPVPPQYAPSPVTHSQAVLHNQEPVYAAAPALENISPEYASAYPFPHPDGGAVIATHHPSQVLQAPVANSQEYYPGAAEHRQQILVGSNHGPIPVQYAAAHTADIYANPNIQVPHDYEALISGSRGQYVAEDARAYGINVNPQTQISAHEPIRVRVLNSNLHSQIYGEDPRGQILTADPRGQILSANPGDHYLADGNQQAFVDPNGHHAAHPITLNPHEVAPSPDYRANYQLPVGPINADTINNGPINQQVLNHGEGSGPARVAFFVPNAVAQQVHEEAPASAVTGSGGGQVAQPEQQAFIVRVAEHESADTDGVTSPSGYYTQNIQY